MKARLRGTLALLFIVAGILTASAQESFIKLTGKIIDSQTQLPIPFANIQLKSKNSGTANNMDGEFIFKIPESQKNNTISISCIKYKTFEKPLSEIGLNISIALEPAAIQLDEVAVKAQTGLDSLSR